MELRLKQSLDLRKQETLSDRASNKEFFNRFQGSKRFGPTPAIRNQMNLNKSKEEKDNGNLFCFIQPSQQVYA
jgi:hypothetical protein